MTSHHQVTRYRRLLAGCLIPAGLVLQTCPSVRGAEPDFYRDVFPSLKASCISCHNKTTSKADLNMETPELMLKGGESGPAIIPGKSGESLIVQASLHTDDLEMPPKNNKSGAVDLTPAEITVLKTWIDQGAKASVQQERQVVWQPLAPGVHPIYSLAMTKDGRYAACGRSNQIFLHDLATRQFIHQIVDDTLKPGGAHQALVQSLAFSPDGTRLASGSFREVKIWRQDQAKAVTRKTDPALGLSLSTLTPDGKQVVAADKTGALVVLDAASGKVIRKIDAVNTTGIKLLGVAPDGSKVAVYGTNAVLNVWSLQDGKTPANKGDVKGVQLMAWTSDGKSLATAGDDKIVRVWTLPATSPGELVAAKELKGSAGTFTALIAGSTPDKLITAGDDSKMRVWSVTTGTVVREIASPGISSLCLSKDGKQLASGGSDGVVRVWDVESGKQTTELRGSLTATKQMAALEWTVAAQELEQAFQKTEIARITAQNKALDELLKKANDTIDSARKSLAEKQKLVKTAKDATAVAKKSADEAAALLAKAPATPPDAALTKQNDVAQDKLTTAEMAERSALGVLSSAENNIKDAEAEVNRISEGQAKNTRSLATANGAAEASIKIHAKAAADLVVAKGALAKPAAKPAAAAFSADGHKVAAISIDGTLKVWAVASGTPVDQVSGSPVPAATLLSSVDGSFAGCAADGTITTTGKAARWVLERVLGGAKSPGLFADRVNAVHFSPDGKTLATGGGEPSRAGDISLFDTTSGKLIKSWKERHEDTVLSLDFSPDGKLLASGGADKMARITDIATGKTVNLFEGHTHHVMGLAFRADGRVLGTAGADGVVIAWNVSLGERKKKIEGWTKEVTSLQFIGATNKMLTSAGDNLVRIINDDGAEVRAIAKLPDFMQAAASTPNGATIIGGGEDSILRVWDGTNGKEVAVFGMK